MVKRPGTPKTNTSGSSGTETGRQEVCPICHGAGYVRLDVLPDHPDFGKAIPCQCKLREIEQRRLQMLQESSNLGLLSRMTFDTFVPDGHGLNSETQSNLRRAYEQAWSYAQAPRGWLILKGGYGCGKTHLAAAIANYQVEQGRPVLFVVVPDLLDHLRAAFGPGSPSSFDERFELVRKAPMLILDDLGAHSGTSWAQEKLYQILNYRYNAQLPTIITSNCELEELDPRLRSRIAELGWSSVLHIVASDYRGSSVAQHSELSSLSLHQEQTLDSFTMRENDASLTAEQRANLKRSLAIARNYARAPDGWLILTGGYGCGKTHLAAAIANERVNAGYAAIFVVVPDLLDHLRAAFAPGSITGFDRRFDEIRRSPLLVMDDLGTHSATPWAQEKLFQIFDYRYNARLATVITMTRDAELDPRLKTRFTDALRCQICEITAPSYRGSGSQVRSASLDQTRSRPGRPARGNRSLGISE